MPSTLNLSLANFILRLSCFLSICVPTLFAVGPQANSQLITSEGLFFYNGQGHACRISFNRLILSHQNPSPINLPYYPSLFDFNYRENGTDHAFSDDGPCQNGYSTIPEGVFLVADGSVYYSNGGGQACRYSNVPSWINVANLAVYPAFPVDLISGGGVCSGWEGNNQYPVGPMLEPNTNFISQGGFYFYNGAGHACQVTYNMAVRDHWDLSQTSLPYYPSLQQLNVVNDGVCNPSGVLLAEGPFLTIDGTVYFSNGLGHACSYAFSGGVDTHPLVMYPTFPSELATYDGQCSISPFIDAKSAGLNPGASGKTNAIILAGLLNISSPAIYLRAGTYTLQSPWQDDVGSPHVLSLPSGTTFAGEGTLLGAGTGVSQAKIEVIGTIDPPIALSYMPIAQSTTTVSLDNDDHVGGLRVHAGDLVMLNNFPTNNVADACTQADENDPCQYNGPSEGALRYYRRRELLQVAAATLTGITFATGTVNEYPLAIQTNGASTFTQWKGVSAYSFIRRIHPVHDVLIRDVEFNHIYIKSVFNADLTFKNVTARQSYLDAASCFSCDVEFLDFDAGRPEIGQIAGPSEFDNEVNFYEGSQNVIVKGNFYGGNCESDCGTVKLDQVHNAHVIGTFGAAPSSTGFHHSVMVDTDYAETPSGFSNGPMTGVVLEATNVLPGSGETPDVFLTGEPWVGASLVDVQLQSNSMPLHVSGVDGVTVFETGVSDFTAERSRGVSLAGGTYGNFKIDSSGEQPYKSAGLSLNGLTLRQRLDAQGHDTWAMMYDTDSVSLTNVTVDTSQRTNPGTLIQFKNMDGLVIDNLKLRCIAGQGGPLKLVADSGNGVTNFVAIGGAGTLPVPFDNVVPNGQTGTTSCPNP